MRTLVILTFLVAAPQVARAAGGFQIDEQSARGTATAGAQTGVATDPAANFYNPAGLAFQPGLGLMVGGHIIVVNTDVQGGGVTTNASHTALLPILYLSQRVGSHVAFGFGLFTQFGEHFGYPTNWPGRFIGQFIDVTTATFNFNIAVRVLPHVSLAAGIDVLPAQLDLYRALNFGAAEGSAHVGADAVGVGGNAALLIELIPKRLRLGVSYRSRVDLDFGGHGSISGPPELRSQTGGRLDAKVTLPLPHNFAIGIGFDPIKALTLSADVKVTLWRDLQTLTLTLTDPQAPPNTAPTQDLLNLQFHNAWAIRIGGEYRLHKRWHLRLGVGYDSTPVPTQTLGPLVPDTQRVVVGGGIGMTWKWVTLDAGYLAVILLTSTANNPDFTATYSTFANVISGTATFRWPHVLNHVKAEEQAESLEE